MREAALHYAQIRATLKTRGTMIRANDLFIAAHAAPWAGWQLDQPPIWIRRGIAFACFGIVTVRTPFFPVALTFSPSTVSGKTKRR